MPRKKRDRKKGKETKKPQSEKKRITKSQVLFPAVRYGIIFALDILLSTSRCFALYLQNDFYGASPFCQLDILTNYKKTLLL